MRKNKIKKDEFLRGREQLKSSLVLGQESTASQMLIYGKHMLYTGNIFDFDARVAAIEGLTLDDISEVIDLSFDETRMAVGAVGKLDRPFKL